MAPDFLRFMCVCVASVTMTVVSGHRIHDSHSLEHNYNYYHDDQQSRWSTTTITTTTTAVSCHASKELLVDALVAHSIYPNGNKSLYKIAEVLHECQNGDYCEISQEEEAFSRHLAREFVFEGKPNREPWFASWLFNVDLSDVGEEVRNILVLWSGLSKAQKKIMQNSKRSVSLHPLSRFGRILNLVGFTDACKDDFEEARPVWQASSTALVQQSFYSILYILLGGRYYAGLENTTLWTIELPTVAKGIQTRCERYRPASSFAETSSSKFHTWVDIGSDSAEDTKKVRARLADLVGEACMEGTHINEYPMDDILTSL